MQRIVVRTCAVAASLAAALMSAGPAWSQPFPSKLIRFVVPYPPGGATDIFARSIAEGITPIFGQQAVVDNRPGAGGTVGAAHVAQSPPDGYTLFAADVAPLTISRSIYKNLRYDSVKDFQPVSQAVVTSLTITVHPSVPVKNVKELIALAKAQPGKINYSSAGIGSILHVPGEVFKMSTGVNIVHVPYKGGAAAVTAVVGGETEMGFLQLPTTMALAQAGKLRILAVTQAKRSRFAPQIPTVAESGVPGFDVSVWQGVVAPKGTPRDVIDKLNAAIIAALNKPEINARLVGQGFDVVTNTPEEFGELIRREAEKWERVVKTANITAE